MIGSLFVSILAYLIFYTVRFVYNALESAVVALPVWLLWNLALPGLFALGSIDYWRAWALVLLCSLVIRGAPPPKWMDSVGTLLDAAETTVPKPPVGKADNEDDADIANSVLVLDPTIMDVLRRSRSSDFGSTSLPRLPRRRSPRRKP